MRQRTSIFRCSGGGLRFRDVLRMLEEASDYQNGIRTRRIPTHRRDEQKPKLHRKGKTKMQIQQSVYETIPAGLYAGKVVAIEDATGDFGPQLKYRIELDSGTNLTTWSSQAFSPKSKLYGWTQAIVFNGAAIPKDYILDTDALLDKPVMVNVTTVDKDGATFNRVKDLLPLPQAKPAQRATAPKAMPPPAARPVVRPADLAQATAEAMPEEPPEVPIEDLVAPI